ncbi:MAG: hypothetical protein QOE28_3126 [Solirubrobacteraceae bacterium]|nr:hypothetical protein [Solirubrobacteraceae bacterium]
MGARATRSPERLALALVAGLALLAAALVSTVFAALTANGCDGTVAQPAPGAGAGSIPPAYLMLYRQAGAANGVPWTVLAGIGAVESDHGRSHIPGVRSGLNGAGCCAGPMQFNLTDGPPSTWQRYAIDGNGDGSEDPYDPADAIPAAGRYLAALLHGANANLGQALLGYNHSTSYAADVLARARAYASDPNAVGLDTLPGEEAALAACADGLDAAARPADLHRAVILTEPRAYQSLPHWAWAGSSDPGAIDARLYPDLIWILRRYHLRVTAARQAGHRTHGDGTAADLVPADGTAQPVWDASAGALARDLGWTPACAASGSRPACPLVPAIQFVGYDGYPGHGSPRTCAGTCPAHVHVSWASPCFGTSALSAPCPTVAAFPVTRST